MSKRNKIFVAFGIFLTSFIIFGQIFHLPNSVRDIVAGAFPQNCHLSYPTPYIIFAPFFHLADLLTILSLGQHFSFLAALVLLWCGTRFILIWGCPITIAVLLREGLKLILWVVGIFIFIAIAVLIPRPMAWLEVTDPDLFVVDFHSHTNNSWDARKSFSIEKNLTWHERAGFHAAFITDHNILSSEVERLQEEIKVETDRIRPLRGEEVSLFQSHWVVLGVTETLSNSLYDRGIEGIRSFLSDLARSKGTFVIASLPEYWLYHWGDTLSLFTKWGVQGFEIVNSAPQALDFTPDLMQSMIRFCSESNLAMVGISDNHGWGSTCYVWNILKVPGWRSLSSKDLEKRVIEVLRRDPQAIQIVVRTKSEFRSSWSYRILDPFLQLWQTSRSLPFSHAILCLIWIWGSLSLILLIGRRHTHAR
ncbi:MAG: hypothetical protein HYY07_02120 [Elusimicrobia bacterium]|nr:hypothetical protein [Elusimicrobiota bacterium]